MQTNLDRFSFGIKDAQEQKVYDECSYCKGEIYFGDSLLESSEGYRIHDDLECVVGFYQLKRIWAGEDII